MESPDRDDLENGASGNPGGNGPPEEGYRWLRSVVHNSSEIVKIVDPNGTLRYASPAFERVLGYDPEKAVGMNVLDYVHPDDLPRVLEETEKALNEPGIGRNVVEYRFRHADGSWRYIEGVGTYLLDEPSIRGVVIHARDVTRRKRAEEALRESERRYATLLSNEPAMVYRCLNEPDWPMEFVSDYSLELTGRSPEELVFDCRYGDLIPQEDRPRVWEEVQQSLSDHRRFKLRYSIRHKDGQIRHVEEYGRGIYDDDGEVVAIEGLVYDITESVRAEERLREAEERYRTLVERIPAIVYIQEPDEPSRTTYVSPQNEVILGYAPEECLADPEHWIKIMHPQDRDRVLAADERTNNTGEPFVMEYRQFARDGRVVWIRDEAILVRDEEGKPLYWLGVQTDVTEQRRADAALGESEQRFRRSFEDAAIGMALVATDGRFLRTNRSLCEIVGYPEGELLQKTFQDLTHPDDLDTDLEHLRRVLAGETRSFQIEKRYIHSEGHVVWGRLSVSLVHGEDGGPLYLVSQIEDVTERKRMEEHLQHRALHDALTELPNRHLFVDRLGHALERTRRRPGRAVAVLFMDLDGFKVVNDSLGHAAGDLLLGILAERLGRCLRLEDTLARFGGDEFVVLVEDVDGAEDAVRVARRITEELRRPFAVEGRELVVAASIGIALGDARTKTPDDLLRDADTAMYRAKESGTGYAVFDPAMYMRALGRLETENYLRRAIERKEFVVHYQPIVDLRSGGLWGMEALVRWNHPERGVLGPSEFVEVAEESGLVVPIGDAVLAEACRRAREWQEGHPRAASLAVSVNLSARQLQRPEQAEIVRGALREAGFEGGCLSLDIAESAYVRVHEGDTEALDRLRAIGVRISIDDFGTGYSSLSYLKRLPADALKIHDSFVRGVGENAEDRAIVRMVIELAHTMGMETVAEGVTSEEQALLLREMGCDFAQGYYFSRPLPTQEVPGFLADYDSPRPPGENGWSPPATP